MRVSSETQDLGREEVFRRDREERGSVISFGEQNVFSVRELTPASSSSHLMSVAIVALQRKYTLSVVVVVVF